MSASVWRTLLSTLFSGIGLIIAAAPLEAGNNVWTTATPQSVGGSSVLTMATQPGTVFAAGGANRVSRSDDGGRSWVAANGGLPLQPISSLQADSTGSTIFAVASDAIYASADEGETWELRMPLARPADDAVMVAAIDPWNPDVVYAWTNYVCGGFCIQWRLRRTTDGGQNWSDLASLAAPVSFKIFFTSPSVGSLVYVLFNGLFFRTDVESDFPTPTSGGGVQDLAVHPISPFVIYEIPSLPGYGHPLQMSADAGTTWSWLSAGPDTSSFETTALIDPASPGNFYLSTYGDGVFRSSDGGATWSRVGNWPSDSPIVSLALSTDGETLYAGTDHAVYQYTFCDSCRRPTPQIAPDRPRSPGTVERRSR